MIELGRSEDGADRREHCSAPSDKNRAGRGISPSRRSGTRKLLLTASALALLIVGCSFCFGTIAGPDADGAVGDRFQVGDYVYTITGTDTVSIYHYKGNSGGEIKIPGTVTYGSTTYTVTSIEDSSFNLSGEQPASVEIPNSVTTIERVAFSRSTNLKSIIIPDSVTSIGVYAFSDCTNLASVEIPNGAVSLAKGAFQNCTRLISVTLPNGAASIGERAFFNCMNLVSVTITGGVTVGLESFRGCTSLKTVTITGDVTSIVDYAFYRCSSLASVAITGSTTSIGNSAFYECSSLKTVTLPDSATFLGAFVFYRCSSLVSIDVPKGVTSIGNSAFNECKSLVSATIPDGVTSIGSDAFYKCKSLVSVTVPDSVTSIGVEAFCECPNLKSVRIPDGVKTIERATFFGCKSLASITIPDGVTSIGTIAFYGCTSLTSITIPDSVTYIGDRTFYDCGLKSITFGTGIAKFDNFAFSFYKRGYNFPMLTQFYDENGNFLPIVFMNNFKGKTFEGDMKKMVLKSPAADLTVDYNMDGGSPQIASASVPKGEYTISETTPVKDGYIFIGWNDGTKVLKSGDKIVLSKSITLTAVWSAVKPIAPSGDTGPNVPGKDL